MAQELLELSRARFQKELNPEDDEIIRNTSLSDVRTTIAQTERQLASRQCLRNFARLSPYLNAIERYGAVVEVFCNSSPIVPYIWGPVKLVILAVKEHTQALDKIITAYVQIGNALPRLSSLQESLKGDRDFQQLFAFLYEDITEFHRRVYKLLNKPAWAIFFAPAWARFEHRFGGLIDNIEKISDLIDKQAATNHIVEVREWRQRSLDSSAAHEKRLESEQFQALLNWLEPEAGKTQEMKLEWQNRRCCEGTMSWITKHHAFRSWMQRRRGKSVLWIYGKPGSGKSVLASQIISFIRTDPNIGSILFFFCDNHTPAHEVTTQILRAFLIQAIRQNPETVPFLYEEYLTKAKKSPPVGKILKEALVSVCKNLDFVRLVVDGIDEVQESEQRTILWELMQVTKLSGEGCKLLVSSQDLQRIRHTLSNSLCLFLGDEKQAIENDMTLVVNASLKELSENLSGAFNEAELALLRASILGKAEGMFLWVSLVLDLLKYSSNLEELKSSVDTLPKGIEELYEKHLNNIHGRCNTRDLPRVTRIFEWLLFAEGSEGLMKYEVLLGSSFHEGCVYLNRGTKPFPNALDICKPLIEDGPGGTINLIHSTLRSFLLGSSSKISISAQSAHEHIAFACVSHLLRMLEFARPDLRLEEMFETIGLGILALQNYASENWTSHILKYLQISQARPSPTIPLMKQLLKLAAQHNDLPRPRLPELDSQALGDPEPAADSCLRSLEALPGVQSLICRVEAFRKIFHEKVTANGPDTLAIDWDTTLFSLADYNYHTAFEQLLTKTSCPGLSSEDLSKFKVEFGKTAFTCPVRGCGRSRIGYSSAIELTNHKRRRHGLLLKCCYGDCAYNEIGFANARSLRQHKNKMHRKPTLHIPTAFKGKRPAEEPTAEVLTSTDRSQQFDFGEFDPEFANPLATNDVLNDFDFDAFLHDNDADDGGFDFTTAANFMDPEVDL